MGGRIPLGFSTVILGSCAGVGSANKLAQRSINEEKENALHFIGLSFCHAAICDHIKHLLQQFTTGKCPKSNCAMMGQLSEQLLVHRIIPEKERGMSVYALPNAATPGRPAIFNPEICDGCNTCVDRCPVDVFIPNPEPGKSPIILHP